MKVTGEEMGVQREKTEDSRGEERDEGDQYEWLLRGSPPPSLLLSFIDKKKETSRRRGLLPIDGPRERPVIGGWMSSGDGCTRVRWPWMLPEIVEDQGLRTGKTWRLRDGR
jgi:hypothetical protein